MSNRISEEYGVSIERASYLTSLQIAILGGAPLLWKPLSNRYGRRPIFLISLVCSLVCNVGCAKSTDYASTAACRALQAFFISPASGKTPSYPIHVPGCADMVKSDRKCGGDGDVFQERSRSIHGCVDSVGHSGDSMRSLHLRFRCVSRRV